MSWRLGCAAGAWIGVADAALALRAVGPLGERLGTMAIALAVDAAVLALLAAVLGGLVGLLLRRERHGACRRVPSGRSLAGVVLAAVIAGGGVAAFAAPGLPPRSIDTLAALPNVVLISVDTLRPDHLGAYGYTRETSPHLTALAAEGVIFEAAYSHSTWTLPAHVSMLTGLDPIAHGVQSSRDRIHPNLETVAERLRDLGYRTLAWVGTPPHGFVGARYGFAAGFERYFHYPHPRRFRGATIPRFVDALLLEFLDRHVGNARDQVDAVIAWLSSRGPGPFFLFVHFYDVHSKWLGLPYEAPDSFRERFCEEDLGGFTGCLEGRCASHRLIAISDGLQPSFSDQELELVRCLYDGGIAFVDEEIGRLLRGLDREAPASETVVIVTSDHGEAFFEHGRPLHTTLHDEVARIPLIIRVPGGAAGKRATGVVSLSDLVPTILELADVEIGEDVQGRSLVAVLREWPVDRSHDVIALDGGVGLVATSLRRGTRKLIEHRQPNGSAASRADELFDLATDVGESWNRHLADPVAARELAEALGARRSASEALRLRLLGSERPDPVELSESERAELRALGYVNSDASERAD